MVCGDVSSISPTKPPRPRPREIAGHAMALRKVNLLAALIAIGCGPNVGSAPLRLSIRTVEDTVLLRRDSSVTAFTVTAIVRNDDSRPVQVALCGMEAERDIGGQWTSVFRPFCASNALSPLAPRDSLIVPVNVYGYTDSNTAPKLDPRMVPGRYRVVFGVYLGNQQRPESSSSSHGQASTLFIVK